MSENTISTTVLPEFSDLYTDEYRYLVYYSGRSTGKSYAVAIGISGYLLILVSCLTTVLAGINMFQPMVKPEQNSEE